MTETIALTVFATWMSAIAIFLWRGISLGTTILAAAVGLSLALGRGFPGLVADSIEVTLDPQVFELLMIIILIFFLSNLLKITRRIDQITRYLKIRLRDPRLVLVAVPALVGLIPMPGGAMFTAPITDEMGEEISLPPIDKVFSNYWFRHFWELAFPLYPGIILASGIAKISPLHLAQTLFPLALTAFFTGILVCFFRWPGPEISSQKAMEATPPSPEAAPSAICLWPLLAVVLMAVVKIPLIPGLLIISLLLAFVEKVGPRDLWKSFADSLQFPIILIIWAVFLFGKTLLSTGLLVILSNFFIHAGMPIWLITLLLPFFLGALTGVTTGFVGPIFPLLMPLWGAHPESWIQLAYAGGLAGVYLSPSHLCLSLTQTYFHANLGKVILLLCIPVGAVVAVALIRLQLG